MLVNLEKDSVIKSLIKLGLPSMIAQVVNMLYNFIDRILVLKHYLHLAYVFLLH